MISTLLNWFSSWGDPVEEPEYMKVRRLAAKLWADDGRAVGRNHGIHGFMVCYPPTREEYENRAKAELGLS